MSILKLQNVVKSFGDYKANNNISMEISGKGAVIGLLGPNGAGKTTLIRMITNILKPDEGSISLFGESANSFHQDRIGYLPEERGLYKKVKVLEQLVYFGQLKGMSAGEANNQAKTWLRKLDAESWGNKKIQELSKGMQQKIQFIGTILHNPDLLILDEPFSGFDPINAELLKKIILDKKAEGKTIILSTHVMEQAEQLCDEIFLINKGRIVLNGKITEIKKNYGKDTVIIEFNGNDSFLNGFSNLKFINRTQNRVEFRIDDSNTKFNDILRAALDSVELYKFELSEPSLHEIFIDVVSNGKEQSHE